MGNLVKGLEYRPTPILKSVNGYKTVDSGKVIQEILFEMLIYKSKLIRQFIRKEKLSSFEISLYLHLLNYIIKCCLVNIVRSTDLIRTTHAF